MRHLRIYDNFTGESSLVNARTTAFAMNMFFEAQHISGNPILCRKQVGLKHDNDCRFIVHDIDSRRNSYYNVDGFALDSESKKVYLVVTVKK